MTFLFALLGFTCVLDAMPLYLTRRHRSSEILGRGKIEMECIFCLPKYKTGRQPKIRETTAPAGIRGSNVRYLSSVSSTLEWGWTSWPSIARTLGQRPASARQRTQVRCGEDWSPTRDYLEAIGRKACRNASSQPARASPETSCHLVIGRDFPVIKSQRRNTSRVEN